MEGWGPSEAQVLGWVLFLTVKAVVWSARLLWWLVCRPWWFLTAVMAAVALGLVPHPTAEPVVWTATGVLVCWCAVAALGSPATRAARRGVARAQTRRAVHVAASELERPELRTWVASRLGGRTGETAGEALGAWATWRQTRRRVRRLVHGTDLPKSVRRHWEARMRETGIDFTGACDAAGLADTRPLPLIDRIAAAATRTNERTEVRA
jgi:hypothetical protein